MIPSTLLSLVIWLSVIGVAAGAGYLLVVLIRDWRSGKLW